MRKRLFRRDLNKWKGIDFCGIRLRKPDNCEKCPYSRPDFKYRECTYTRCPYDESKTTFRDRPLREEDVIQRRRKEMKPWERQQLRQ